jgi:hypothetical protein
MRRPIVLAAVAGLAACAGETRHVSKFRMPHGGTCPDDVGCEAPLPAEPRYELPDSARPHPAPPADLGAGARAEATCALVGAELASLEVGNYAEPEVVAPIASKYEARCDREKLTLEERTCIATARGDRASLSYCASRMFPDAPAAAFVPVAECAAIAAGVRAKAKGMRGLSPPQMRLWTERLAAVEPSCVLDRWTAAFGACVRANSSGEPLPICVRAASVPPPLRAKIEARLREAQRNAFSQP